MRILQKHWSYLAVALAATAFACVKGEQSAQRADSTARNLTLAPTESSAAMKDVTAAEPAPNPNSSGKIELAVKSVTVRGTSYPVDATVVSKDTVMQGRGVTGADAAKVAGGAAIGAIAGRLLGKNAKGAVVGGAAGAAAGAVAASKSRDIDVVIPKGAAITIKLDKPLTVKRV